MSFTIFDFIIFAVILCSSMLGVYRGMLYIVINFLGFILSIALAIFFYGYIKKIFAVYVTNELILSVSSGVTAYISSLVICTIISSRIVKMFGDVSKNGLDRFMGLILGFIRGAIISLFVFFVVLIFTTKIYLDTKEPKEIAKNIELAKYKSSDKYPSWLKDSVSTEFLENAVRFIIKVTPDEAFKAIKIPANNDSEKDANFMIDDIASIAEK